MSFLSSLVAWANVPFTAAIAAAVLFAIVQASGLLGLLGGHGDDGAHGDGHGDGHAGHDAGHAHDGHHGAHAGGADHAADHGVAAALGVGRVPFSIVWQTYAVAFGLTGVVANAFYLGRAGALPAHTLAWTVPLALLVGFAVTRGVARALDRVVAAPHAEATTRRGLVGHAGVVISSKVSPEFGEVRIRDKTGHVVRVVCTTRDGETPIPEGREVVVVEYDADRDRLLVAPLDDADAPAARRAS